MAAVSTGLAIAGLVSGAATNLINAHKQAKSNDKATAAQTKASDDALALEKQQYEQQRQDEQQKYTDTRTDSEPYRRIGAQSLAKLAELMGFDAQASLPPLQTLSTTAGGGMTSQTGSERGPQAPTPPGAIPGTQSGTMPGAPGTSAGGGSERTVIVKAPDGRVGAIPASQLGAALQAGGQQVG